MVERIYGREHSTIIKLYLLITVMTRVLRCGEMAARKSPALRCDAPCDTQVLFAYAKKGACNSFALARSTGVNSTRLTI